MNEYPEINICYEEKLYRLQLGERTARVNLKYRKDFWEDILMRISGHAVEEHYRVDRARAKIIQKEEHWYERKFSDYLHHNEQDHLE